MRTKKVSITYSFASFARVTYLGWFLVKSSMERDGSIEISEILARKECIEVHLNE